jgi:hypothetical protein
VSTPPLFTTPTPPGVITPYPPKPLIHQVTVDRAIISFLQRWLPTYLTEMERREHKPTRWLPRPQVFTTTYEEDDADFFSNARLPTVIVTAGEASDWTRDGDSHWSAMYRTAISVVSRGRSMPEARLQSSLYTATVTALLLDKPSLEGFAGGVEVISERPRPVEDLSNRSRSLSAGLGTYDIWVPFIRQGLHSPFTTPDIEEPPDPPINPDDPWPETPDANDVDVDFVGHPPPSVEDE